MNPVSLPPSQNRRSSYAALFVPKLVTVLREGYGWRHLGADLFAGLTVAIVALPFSMAIAIASGVTPAAGLYTAIVGGFFVSLLGGSRFQIGGPAGAFIVLVAATVSQFGFDGLVLATFMSGFMLAAVGLLRLGGFIKFIPYPVTVGFTAGIAVIIFVSQLPDFLGIGLSSQIQGLAKVLPALWELRESLRPEAVGLAIATIAIILTIRHFRPTWPTMLISITLTSVFAKFAGLSVATIGSQFGGIPSSLPMPGLPAFTIEKAIAVLPMAAAFTLLGAIESLLSAVVADGMTGRRHRSNCELLAQGVANVASSLFGGFCVTGTVARTATSIRSRAQSPLAGIFHSVFLLLFLVLAAPLGAYIPLASLAGVLAVVAWNMIDRQAIGSIFRSEKGEAMILMVTLLLTIFRSLIEGIIVGFVLGSVLFIRRISMMTTATSHLPYASIDLADEVEPRGEYDSGFLHSDGIVIYRITGALFFGATGVISSVLENIWGDLRVLVIDFAAVPFVDTSGANLVLGIARNAKKNEVSVWLTGVDPAMHMTLLAHGLKPPLVNYAATPEGVVAPELQKNREEQEIS